MSKWSEPGSSPVDDVRAVIKQLRDQPPMIYLGQCARCGDKSNAALCIRCLDFLDSDEVEAYNDARAVGE